LSMTVSLGPNSPAINMAVGTTQYGAGPQVTPENLFQIGSNTKVFTSIAILQLEAAGVLSINDTLGKWLPQYPAWSAVTIRQLLDMTSGIPSYDNSPAFEAAYSSNPMIQTTPEELVSYVYPSTVTPGVAWSYSNTGYILAQMIVEKASPTQSYSTVIDQIIRSQKLQNTFYQPYFYPAAVQQRVVSGYYVNDDPGLQKLYGMDTSGFSLGWAQGAGGIVGNPADLTQFMRAVFTGNMLPAAQLQELESIVSTKTGQPIAQTTPTDPSAFGLGVFQILLPNFPRAWAYQGSTIGYRATYMYFPSSGLIITIFTNSQTTQVQNQITAQLFPAVYKTIQAAGFAPSN
jgi:D-alanyl-D-alanine carboxypeptidase